MKKQRLARSLLLCLLAALLLFAVACSTQPETPSATPDAEQNAGGEVSKQGLWANATYTKDTELGEGAKTVKVKISAEGQAITVTLHTDAQTLADALKAHHLIDGEDGVYGIMIYVVNGIEAKYENGGYWWGITKAGVATETGADGVVIADGEQYELIRTNQY